MPQLLYTSEAAEGQPVAERWQEAVRDAGSVDWKPALRLALLLALPAGVLSSGISPLGFFGLVWMSVAAAWAVLLYIRSQSPAWITAGAGARIGLVTGILAGWFSFGLSGIALFVQRFFLHQAGAMDAEWSSRVALGQQMAEQVTAGMNAADAAQAQAARAQFQAWMLSPEGHAGMEAFRMATSSLFLLCFAAAGGALGARLMARSRRPEI